MITLDEARMLLLAGIEPMATEAVALDAAAGRVLAADLTAQFDQPASARSAMDGYAVAAGDAVVGAELRIVGSALAGAPFEDRLERGTAVRIATGGVVPEGSERVVMQERVVRDGDCIKLVGPLDEARFIRPHGGDFAAGDVLLRAGDQLTPARIGLAAAAGFAELLVRRRPRITVLASGDEIKEPGALIGPGDTYNSASFAIQALVQGWSGEARRGSSLPDDFDLASVQLAAARNCDILVLIGGASVGDRDVLRPVVEALDGVIVFAGIAIQPGKPCWHARFAGGPLVLGLPGNPASAFVCAHLLLEPLIAQLLCRVSLTGLRPALLSDPLPAGGRRESYLRASASIDRDARLVAAPDLRSDSSLQVPLASSNALILRAIDAPAADAGALVEIFLTGPSPTPIDVAARPL